MKIIKLDKRHREYRHGFTHAFRFDSYCANAMDIERYLKRAYPGGERIKWCSYFGTRNNYTRYSVYWVCVRNDAILTMALLSIDHTRGFA